MPSFTNVSPNLQGLGPVVEVQLAVGAQVEQVLRDSSSQIPTPITVHALIDTGASGCVIQEGLATRLGLTPVGMVAINTPSSTNVKCSQYLVRFLLPNAVTVEGLVVEAPLQGQHIQCLIGRDLLVHSVLVYIGYANLFSLSF